jgi:hypothetical protein
MLIDCLLPFVRLSALFSLRSDSRARIAVSAAMALLWVFGPAATLHATQVPTTTTISITTTDGTSVNSVASGTVVVLTAGVTQPSIDHPNVTTGMVNFCDADAAHCEDGHLIAAAQLRSNGTAVFKFKPAPGEHNYYAQFAGTIGVGTGLASSTSFTIGLTVAGGPFATTTSIVQSGSAGNYTLNATVTSANATFLSPSGTVDFLDTSNSNYVLGSSPLTPGTATSSYAPFVGYSPGGNIGVLVADFNQDGIPDLLVWAEGTYVFNGNNYLGVLLGKGDGTYQNVAGYNFDTNAISPSGIAVGDVNGDGYPDVIVADAQTSRIYVLLNDGNSSGHLGWQHTYQFPTFSFNGSVQLPVGPVTGIAIGDVNGDGKPDLAITLATYGDPNTAPVDFENAGVFGVMLGNGDGSFQMTGSAPWVTSYPSGFYAEARWQPEPIELVDTRGNGRLDVVVTDENHGGACVSLNNGDGTFASPACYGSPAGQSVAVGDFNGDGKPDLVATSWYTANGSSVELLGNGDGTFHNGANLPSGISSAAVGDLNGDGKLDLVLTTNSTSGGPATVQILYGKGDGTFGTSTALNAGANGAILNSSAVADLNGDGVPDIVGADPAGTANVMLGSVAKTATATATGISPVGPVTNADAVKASYEGDDLYSGSASGTTSLTPQPVPTTLALQSNLSSVTVGSQVTLTATLSPASSQGYSSNGESITFYNNGNSIGTAALTNGVATLKPHLNVVQSASLTASYAGDSNFNSSSTSSAVSVTVQKASTTLTLQICIPTSSTWICPAPFSSYGQLVAITATLSPFNVTGGGTSDGETITFSNNGTTLGTATLTDGAATLYLDQLNAGSYSITASYDGDSSFIASSTSSSSSLTVQQDTSTISLQTFPGSSSDYGQQVVLTATFGPPQPYSHSTDGETVTFFNNGNSIGTATLSNLSATLRLDNLPVAPYSFAVHYPGDQNFIASNSSPVFFAVQKLSTNLFVSPSPSDFTTYGNPITVQAFLLPSNVPGGNSTNGETVTFFDNGNIIGTATLTNGAAMYTLNVPPAGSNSFAASFPGDPSFASSLGSANGLVSVQPAHTGMGITSSAVNGISATGRPVTLTATLSPYAVAGGAGTNGEAVTFFNNGNSIGTGTLTNGVATLVVNGLSQGLYTFAATYPGDGNFTFSSTSVPTSVNVLQATSLTLATNPAHFAALNQAVSLTATLSPSSGPGYSTNGELIVFYDGATNLGTASLTNGVATLSFPNGLPQKAYSFTVQYLGDTFLAGSNTSANPVPFSVATTENFVVNYEWDNAGTASNCTPQNSTTSNTTDSGCSLRDALLAAAAAPEGANITFDTSTFIGPTTISLTNGTLTVPANTTLTGPTFYGGANLLNLVTIDGGGNTSVQTFGDFAVTGTGAAIKNFVITGGYPVWNNGNPLPGGGIANSGSLTLTNCEITGNGSIMSAGGIYNTGTLTVIGSTIDNNLAAYNGPGNGAGIDNENNGTLTIVNSTIADNSALSGFGGGIYLGSGTLTMTNSTVSSNLGARHNGIDNEGSGAVTLANSIVSGNVGVFFNDIVGNYTDNGGNIIGTANGNLISSANSLKLGALGNNSGPTQTMLPLPGSMAICAGSILLSPSQWEPQSVQIDTDQRGFLNYTEAYQPLGGPSLCVDAGAVQTAYTSIQFLQSSYAGSPGAAVTPAVVVEVAENGQNRGAIPITLSYSGSGALSGNTATTVEGAGATFSNLSVDTAGSGQLHATLSITPCVTECSFVQLSASANLQLLAPAQIAPGAEIISVAYGAPFTKTFNVSGATGSYQLGSTTTLPTGMTLTPAGSASGSSWTLNGTPTQSGAFSFALTATDATHSSFTDSESYSFNVAPPSSTLLAASPASSAAFGQTVTLTATVPSPTATGTVTFYDGVNALGPGSVSLSGGSSNTASIDLNAATLGSSLAPGAHSFTAQYSGDVNNAPSSSDPLAYTVNPPVFVVNTNSDDSGSYTCTPLASTTSNTTDGNNGGNPGLCALRDALNSASAVGGGNIYFDTTVFAASNLAGNPAANTIAINNPANGGSLSIPSNTVIQGFTSGSGATLANLVTVDGGGAGLPDNGTTFIVNGTGAAIDNLNINNGYASDGGNGGAITNFGSITISGSSFNGNQASVSGGGIFNVGGSVIVAGSTFIGNAATGGFGGAIDNNSQYPNCGTVTVTNSTFYQNSAVNGGLGAGGAIYNDGPGCQLTVINSTIYGNSTDNASASGVGIYSNFGSLTNLANSIVSGNANSSSAEDDLYNNSGNLNDQGGNVVSYAAAQILLAPPVSNSGPTQTLLPLPGSPSICAGLVANIAAGVTTDQRGLPDTNTSYPGYSSTPCVDAGAVQTNYAIAFTQQPSTSGAPATIALASTISPAPAVSLTESGMPVDGPAISIADAANALNGTLTQSSAAGSATFGDLSIGTIEINDTLTASIPLNSGFPLSLSTTSYPFNVGFTPPTLNMPAPGSTLSGSSANFGWDPGDATTFQFRLGTVRGSNNVFGSGRTNLTSVTAPNLPTNGSTLYATLYYLVGGAWQQITGTYIEAGSPTPPVLLTPAPGSTLTGSSVTFTWDPGTETKFKFTVGRELGGNGLYGSGPTTATSVTVNNLPTTGTIHARLYYLVNGTWNSIDYVYYTQTYLTSPAPSSTLSGSAVTFSWSPGSATAFQFRVGNFQGGNGLYGSGIIHATSVTVPNLPTDGRTIHGRLYYEVNGTWNSTDYTFTTGP